MTEFDELGTGRRKLGDQLVEGLACDTCGAPATFVHLLPGCVDPKEVALTGTCDCRTEQVDEIAEEQVEDEEFADASKPPEQLGGGYFFPIREWSWQFSHESGGNWSMRDQLRTKIRGERAIAMVDRRLRVAVEPDPH